jgi:hypothetical protein
MMVTTCTALLSIHMTQSLIHHDIASVCDAQVRLDQGTCLFLAAFLAPAAADEAPVLVSAPGASDEDEALTAAADAAQDGAGPFFSKVAVCGWSVVVDYKPRRVDLGALRTGALIEVRRLAKPAVLPTALPPSGCIGQWVRMSSIGGSKNPQHQVTCLTGQVLNLVPWGGVALRLPPVALSDAEGWPAVARGIAAEYIADITTHQVAAIEAFMACPI